MSMIDSLSLPTQPLDQPSQAERRPPKKKNKKTFANVNFADLRAEPVYRPPSIVRPDHPEGQQKQPDPPPLKRFPTWATLPPSPPPTIAPPKPKNVSAPTRAKVQKRPLETPPTTTPAQPSSDSLTISPKKWSAKSAPARAKEPDPPHVIPPETAPHQPTSDLSPPKAPKKPRKQAKAVPDPASGPPSKRSRKSKKKDDPPPLPTPLVLTEPEEGEYSTGGLWIPSSQPEIREAGKGKEAEKRQEPTVGEGSKSKKNTTSARRKGKSKEREEEKQNEKEKETETTGEADSSTAQRDIPPHTPLFDQADSDYDLDGLDDEVLAALANPYELVPASQTPAPAHDSPASDTVPTVSSRKGRQSRITTPYRDSLLDEIIAPIPRRGKIQRDENFHFVPSLLLDDQEEDEEESPLSRPTTRRSKSHWRIYSLSGSQESQEMPPAGQSKRAGRLTRSPSVIFSSQKEWEDSDEEELYDSQRDGPQPGQRHSSYPLSPDDASQSQPTSKPSRKSQRTALPKVNTYSKRRPRVWVPGFPHPLDPAQRLQFSPEPDWLKHRSKRHGSTSAWPPTQISDERTPLGEIELERDIFQDEWHKTARSRNRVLRNGRWPEAREVPGLFDPSSPTEAPRYWRGELMQPITKAWNVERNPDLPPWVQDEDVRIVEDGHHGKRRAPPPGANELVGPPRTKLRMIRANTQAEERLDNYIQLLRHPKPAPSYKEVIAKRKRRTKIQREFDDIPTSMLKSIKKVPFEEFKQDYRDHSDEPRFFNNESLIKAAEKDQRNAAWRPVIRQRSDSRPIVRRKRSMMVDAEGIDVFTPSAEWMRRHGRNVPMPTRTHVPRIPQLSFTSSSAAPERDPHTTDKTHNMSHTIVTPDTTPNRPSNRPSETATPRLEPAPSSEYIGSNVPRQQKQRVRIESAPQEQPMGNPASDHAQETPDQHSKIPTPPEEVIQKLREDVEHGLADPINDEDFLSMPSADRRAAIDAASDPQEGVEAAAKALTGMGMTQYLMEIVRKLPETPSRKSAPGLRRSKLDDRSRRLELKRQQPDDRLPERDRSSRSRYQEQADPTPQTTRSKTVVRSTPARMGLSQRSKSVGAPSSQPTMRELKKRNDEKSNAALTTPYRNPTLSSLHPAFRSPSPAPVVSTGPALPSLDPQEEEHADLPTLGQLRFSKALSPTQVVTQTASKTPSLPPSLPFPPPRQAFGEMTSSGTASIKPSHARSSSTRLFTQEPASHAQKGATGPLSQQVPHSSPSRPPKRHATLGSRPLFDSQEVFKKFKAPQTAPTPIEARQDERESGSEEVEVVENSLVEATSSAAKRKAELMMKEADEDAASRSQSWTKGYYWKDH